MGWSRSRRGRLRRPAVVEFLVISLQDFGLASDSVRSLHNLLSPILMAELAILEDCDRDANKELIYQCVSQTAFSIKNRMVNSVCLTLISEQTSSTYLLLSRVACRCGPIDLGVSLSFFVVSTAFSYSLLSYLPSLRVRTLTQA